MSLASTAATRPPSARASRPRRAPARVLAARTALLALSALSALPALPLAAAPALAHERLVRSAPARGDTLDRAPAELRLTFSSRVELAFSGIDLLGPEGRPVALGPLSSPPDSNRLLVTAVLGAMPPGRYTVAWRTGGADGHPVRGEYVFVVRGPPDTVPAAAVASPEMEDAGHAGHGDEEPAAGEAAAPASSPLQVGVRWVTFVALLGVIGVVAFRWLVLPRAASGTPDGFGARAAGAARALGAMLAIVLVAAVLARLGAQWAALGGAGADTSMSRVLATTEWGWGWIAQMTGALLALAGLLLARRSARGWLLAGAALLPLAVAPALSGHAAATGPLAPLTIAADAVHVLAAGVWIGTLLVLVLAALPVALARPAGDRAAPAARLFRTFSPIALAAAGVLLASGVASAWVQLGSAGALLSSDYGRMLLRKLVVLALVAAVGAFHWRRALPALGTDAGVRALRRSAAIELALAGVVLLFTALLVATPPPAH